MEPRTSNTPYRRSTRVRVPIVYAQDAPFPDGPPTEPAHFDIIRFSSQSDGHLRLGMVDNIVVYLLFSTKRYRPAARTLIPPKLPELFDAIHAIPRAVSSTVGKLRQRIAAQPVNRDHWLRCIDDARGEWRVHLTEPIISVIEDVLFQRTMMRYIPLVTQERVRVGGVRFNNMTTRQCGIIATDNIEENTCLWELTGIVSIDSLQNGSLSAIVPHMCQKLDSTPHLMAGPAHLVNHSCRPNAEVCTHRPLFVWPDLHYSSLCLCLNCRCLSSPP